MKFATERFAFDNQLLQLAEIGEHERARRISVAADMHHTRSRTHAALQFEARHAPPRADRAALELDTARLECARVVRFVNRERLHVVEIAIVAFEHERIHARVFASDARIRSNGRANLRIGERADAERVGQRDRRFDHAKLVDLNEPDALAEPVDDARRSGHLVAIPSPSCGRITVTPVCTAPCASVQ